MESQSVMIITVSTPFPKQTQPDGAHDAAKGDVFSRDLGAFLACTGIGISVYFYLHGLVCTELDTNSSCPKFTSLIELGLFLLGLGVFFVVISYPKLRSKPASLNVSCLP